jgi:hypothetical protein
VGRYIESDPMGQRAYFDFSNLLAVDPRHRGYWNHLYNYADGRPTLVTDRYGLGPAWLDWLLEFFNDKTPEQVTSKSVGAGLSALCITQNCGKTRSYVDLYGDCTSLLNKWAKDDPAILALIGSVAGDGGQAAVSDCAELCGKGIKTGTCGCKDGKQ